MCLHYVRIRVSQSWRPVAEERLFYQPLTGLELAKVLNQSPETKTRVVFTTAYNQFAVQGYEVDALGLPSGKFTRIHRSFIVVVGKVDSISKSAVHIGNVDIPVGDLYKDAFRELLAKWQ